MSHVSWVAGVMCHDSYPGVEQGLKLKPTVCFQAVVLHFYEGVLLGGWKLPNAFCLPYTKEFC